MILIFSYSLDFDCFSFCVVLLHLFSFTEVVVTDPCRENSGRQFMLIYQLHKKLEPNIHLSLFRYNLSVFKPETNKCYIN